MAGAGSTTGGGADAWGILRDWTDADGRPQRVSDETVTRLREVIGRAPEELEATAPVVTRPGRDPRLGRIQVACEDGSEREVDGRLPDDFPLGYHRCRTADGHERRLIVSPGRCWLPERQVWGWTVQLYAARSSTSWGMGDLGDLRTLREWTEREGGGFVLVNPLHAVAPVAPLEPSPYLPATRRFRNPVYLRVEEVPGFSASDAEVTALQGPGPVDRDAVWEAKRRALRAAYERSDSGRADAAFEQWRREQGPALEEFATWSVLTEQHGPDWHRWPEPLRRPQSPDVAAFHASHRDEAGFHAWLQWQLDVQLRAASGGLTVIQDLPIGVSGGGADAWAWQDVLAQGVTVGAPPDTFNTLGQDWGSPPLVPWRLRAAGYEPFIQSVRATIAGAGGLRIDHVMGLFRLWWVPEDAGAADGAYVRYPSDDLLDIVALESHRAGAVVVGEDLGTVEPGVPEALAGRRVLSYKVLWFEEDDPEDWPVRALAAVTTHDLPTVAGLWSGADAEDQLESTEMPEEDVRRGREDLLRRLREGADLGPEASTADAVDSAYRQLARCPSLLLSLSLEDAVLEERRPNIPGTVERDNWSIPLPVAVDGLDEVPEVTRLVRLVSAAVEERLREGDGAVAAPSR